MFKIGGPVDPKWTGKTVSAEWMNLALQDELVALVGLSGKGGSFKTDTKRMHQSVKRLLEAGKQKLKRKVGMSKENKSAVVLEVAKYIVDQAKQYDDTVGKYIHQAQEDNATIDTLKARLTATRESSSDLHNTLVERDKIIARLKTVIRIANENEKIKKPKNLKTINKG